jgi:hypothetical protein
MTEVLKDRLIDLPSVRDESRFVEFKPMTVESVSSPVSQ